MLLRLFGWYHCLRSYQLADRGSSVLNALYLSPAWLQHILRREEHIYMRRMMDNIKKMGVKLTNRAILAVDRRHLVLIRRRTPVGVRPKTDCRDDCGDPHTPQPRRADHERSVSGHNSLFLGYPELACVGIGAGEAAVVVWSVSRSLAPPLDEKNPGCRFRVTTPTPRSPRIRPCRSGRGESPRR